MAVVNKRCTHCTQYIPVASMVCPKCDHDQSAPDSAKPGQSNLNIYQGIGATIELRPDGIIIRRKGAISFINHGIKGEKLMPFKSITSVQFKPPGAVTNGYIQFGLAGGKESGGGIFAATKDENTVMFSKAQGGPMGMLRYKVEEAIADAHGSGAPGKATPSLADELGKLADLRDRGVLTQAEFDAQKAALLA